MQCRPDQRCLGFETRRAEGLNANEKRLNAGRRDGFLAKKVLLSIRGC